MTRAQESFPRRLHALLDDVERKGLSHIISWLPGGRAFKIHAKEHFVEKILQEYFNTDKIKSFQRNLNLYGFNTVSKGREKGVCSHPLFLRDDPERCRIMTRVVVKGEGPRRRVPSSGEEYSSKSSAAIKKTIQASNDESSASASEASANVTEATPANVVSQPGTVASSVTHTAPSMETPNNGTNQENAPFQDPFFLLAARELVLQQQQQQQQQEQEMMQQLLAQMQQNQLLQELQQQQQQQHQQQDSPNNLLAALQTIQTLLAAQQQESV